MSECVSLRDAPGTGVVDLGRLRKVLAIFIADADCGHDLERCDCSDNRATPAEIIAWLELYISHPPPRPLAQALSQSRGARWKRRFDAEQRRKRGRRGGRRTAASA